MKYQSYLPQSGRGVKFTLLSPTVRDKVLTDAARVCGDNANFFELRQTEARLGVKMMLSEITEKSDLTEDDLLKPETKWKKLSFAEIDDKYDAMFADPREHQALCALFRHFNDASPDEVRAIVGKTLPVSEG